MKREVPVKKDLRMEVFSSKDIVKAMGLHVYQLHTQKIDNKFSIIRGPVKMVGNYFDVGAFEDKKRIYTTEKIEETVPNADFTLKYEGFCELPVLENKEIYCNLIKYFITQNLKKVKFFNKYRKYSCKNEVTSKWIMTNEGFKTFISNNKEINFERKYNIKVEILDNGKAYLKLDTKSIFIPNFTVNDYLVKGINPIGMEVKNYWAEYEQTGTLIEICDFTVTDKLDFVDSLKAYYIGNNKGYLVEKIPDDTKVVKVKLKSGKVGLYYPHALKRVLTREKVGQIDPSFSNDIDQYLKRNMQTRLELDIDFIKDIGSISELSNLEFNTIPCPVEEMGYKKGTIPLPELICGKNKVIKCGKEFQVFNNGFYQKPNKEIKIGYIYPKNTYDKMKAVVNEIYSFAKHGKYQGEKDKYTVKGLLDIQRAPMIMKEYELGRDLTDYKRAANEVKEVSGIDIVIALVPDGFDEDGPYNPFKRVWAKANILSQMISMKTAELFAEGKKEGRYYLHNIILGILGKIGGIPWIVKEMPGNVDCFVGLDVATVEGGIHYPASSVVFDKYGRLLGFYKPETPQKGEKITTKILRDIFDEVILSYEGRFKEMPKNVVIHRDGFSNENDDWYKNYFGAKGIKYSIIEVRKNVHSKLMFLEDGKVKNPEIGHCLYNDNEGYLVTTDIEKGSPNPILIEKKCGDLSMVKILKQILYLSRLHVGSTRQMRLPITTGYADKICKNRDFVPEGKMDNRLFFL